MFRIRKIIITSKHMSIRINLTHCFVVFRIAEFTGTFRNYFSVFKIEFYFRLEEAEALPVLRMVDAGQRLFGGRVTLAVVDVLLFFGGEPSAYFFVV